MSRFRPSATLVAVALIMTGCADDGREHGIVDLAIIDGLIVDGTGRKPRTGDVLVRGGEIVFVGEAPSSSFKAKRTILAAGKLVTPGFIDLHSHGNPLIDASFDNFLLQGVTTILLGQDGRSPQVDAGEDDPEPPTLAAWRAARERRTGVAQTPITLGHWLDAAGRKPLDVNIAALSGFGTNRKIAGTGASPVPSPEQLAAEKEILRADLEAGAFGLSSGLEYPPDRYSRTQELVQLAALVGEYGGVVMSHMRSEDDDKIAGAIAELAAQGRQARVNISHLKIVFGQERAQARAVLEQIRAARANGIEMSADVYPYLAGFADLSLVYPPWAQQEAEWKAAIRDRRPQLEAYLRQRVMKRNGPEAILITTGPYAGLTLKQVAEREKEDFVDTIIDRFDFGGPKAAHRVMSADVQEAFIAAPDVAISTDGGPRIRHPRSWGSYPKVLHDYVASGGRLPIETAIYKMTLLPARVLRLSDRGRIAPGAKADLLVIDLAKVESPATFEKFDQAPIGFEAVVVNGVVAADNGRRTARNGQVLRRNARAEERALKSKE